MLIPHSFLYRGSFIESMCNLISRALGPIIINSCRRFGFSLWKEVWLQWYSSVVLTKTIILWQENTSVLYNNEQKTTD